MSTQINEQEIEELKSVGANVVKRLAEAGASASEVMVALGSELSVKVRRGEPELVQQATSRALGVRVFVGQRQAVTYTSDLRDESLREFARAAVELAKYAEEDELAGLPGVEELATSLPALDLYDAKIPDLDAAWAIERCRETEAAAMAADARINNSDGAMWSSGVGATVFANSLGFVGGYRGTSASISAEVMCDDDRDPSKKRNGSWWTAGRFLERLESGESVGRRAAERTVAQLGTRKIMTQTCPIVFDPEAARSLLGAIIGVTNGSALWRKSSYLVGKEGERIASELVTVVDDALMVRGSGSRPFDGDGLPTRRNVIIDKGRFATALCDVYSARKLGRKSTGSAGRGIGGTPGPTTSNLYMEAGGISRRDLLASTASGLYVTHMMGFGFNPTTGDYSRGAQGFWIENGELTFPVSEITISANLADILGGIDAVADDLLFRGSSACPTLRVREMMVAGTEQ